MDIYSTLNEITLYIDTHLKENLDMNYIGSQCLYYAKNLFFTSRGDDYSIYKKTKTNELRIGFIRRKKCNGSRFRL